MGFPLEVACALYGATALVAGRDQETCWSLSCFYPSNVDVAIFGVNMGDNPMNMYVYHLRSARCGTAHAFSWHTGGLTSGQHR